MTVLGKNCVRFWTHFEGRITTFSNTLYVGCEGLRNVQGLEPQHFTGMENTWRSRLGGKGKFRSSVSER